MAEYERESQNLVHSTVPAGFDTEGRPNLQILPSEAASLRVEVVGGPMDGQRSSVSGAVLNIGREEGNDLSLPLDRSISSKHARILREHDQFWLEDLKSTNGTYLGYKRIQERTLIGPGTLFTVGRTSLEFSLR